MAEEVRITDCNRVTDWETGLPELTDLPPLSHLLISPELASAFSITPETHRSMADVDLASRNTLSTLQQHSQHHMLNIDKNNNDVKSVSDDREEEMVVEGEEVVDLVREGSPVRKSQRVDKRIRLVWTPQLHKRFVEVVAHLGVKNVVPKTIMQLMNVEGLTRENVASHLQKYRLYLKRMQGLSNEEASCSDHDSGPAASIRTPYAPHMVPMPYPPPPTPQIVPSGSGSGSGGGGGGYHHQGFEYHSHPYNMMMQPKDWSRNNIGSVSAYQHNSMSPNQK